MSEPVRTSYRTALNKAQQYLAYDTSIVAAEQRELITTALRELKNGTLTDEVEATVRMAESVVEGKSC